MKKFLVSMAGILIGVTSLGLIRIRRQKKVDGSSNFDFSLLDIQSNADVINVYHFDINNDSAITLDEVILVEPDASFEVPVSATNIGRFERQDDGSFKYLATI